MFQSGNPDHTSRLSKKKWATKQPLTWTVPFGTKNKKEIWELVPSIWKIPFN